jgi:hypothetical protein
MSNVPEAIYYECHVTVSPVFDEKIEQFKSICQRHQFSVAKLLMVKGGASKKDSFCTGRSLYYEDILNRMTGLVRELQLSDFEVWRYKIEVAVLDVKLPRKVASV